MRSKTPGLIKFKPNYLSNSSFFSSLPSFLSSDFQELPIQPDVSKVNDLLNYKEQRMQVMRTNFPWVMEDAFSPGRIVYRLCDISPAEMVKNGGFKSLSPLNLATTGSGDNTGSICFSLLPECAAIFNDHFPKDRKKFMYACLLTGIFFAPGGKWRQVVTPGSLPIPRFWIAREVVDITQNRRMIFGPMIGHAHSRQDIIWGDSFKVFTQPSLKIPNIIDYGHEDKEIEFEIIDRPDSKKFQEKVNLYYSQDFLERTKHQHPPAP